MKAISIIPGSILTTSLATYYTVPALDAKTRQVQLTGVRFTNTDTVSRTVSLHIVPLGATASVATVRMSTVTIPANGESSAFYAMDDVLLPGWSIQSLASVPNVVAISANGAVYPG